jgi:hypothetical protein
MFVTKANPLIGQMSYVIKCLSGGKVALDVGDDRGGPGARLEHSMALRAGRWYHIAVTFDDAAHTGTLSVWDETAQALLGADSQKTDFPTMGTTDDAFVIGSADEIWYASLDGLMDELAVLKDVLTAGEIAKIRAGTYGKSK